MGGRDVLRRRRADTSRGPTLHRPPSDERRRVLVVGQVPPPYHGQAIMVDTLLRGRYRAVELVHVEASYSTSLEQVGTASLDKVRRMMGVVCRTLWQRVSTGAPVLYYHPAGANRSAVVRDAVVLTIIRPFFPCTVFHHHARGLLSAVQQLPQPLRAVARRSYRSPDVAIAPSEALLEEARQLHPAHAVVVPNGTRGGVPAAAHPGRDQPRILFLNLISEAKGARWLLEAVAELHGRDTPVDVVFAGEFPSPEARSEFVADVRRQGLEDSVQLVGLVVGDDKWATFASADVFCVPTTYEQESFGLALVEAASCGLAIVATDVPGLREVFRHGETALLADPEQPGSLADLLESVCTDEVRRKELGQNARLLFEQRYTVERFWAALDDVFNDVAARVDQSSAPERGRDR